MLNKSAINKYPFTLYLPAIWFGSTVLSIILLIVLMFFDTGSTKTPQKYSLYSSKPLVLGTMTGETGLGDSRVEKINQVFEEHNCPLEGLGDVFVAEADKNNIPYWVVAAISFQESSCGKRVPGVDGDPSYNAWGWAVYGNLVKQFDSWEHGIEVVSEYMDERFFSQGITDLCEIMRTYTPPSQGSWCEGVDYFKDIIHEYQTPLL